MLNDKEFSVGRASDLHFKDPDSIATSGHAVAVKHVSPGLFHLFDPNFGVWELDGSGLRKAVTFIFVTAYPNYFPGGADCHAYQTENGVKGGYTIFRRKVEEEVKTTIITSTPLYTESPQAGHPGSNCDGKYHDDGLEAIDADLEADNAELQLGGTAQEAVRRTSGRARRDYKS